jgi:acyl dehydratase
MTTDVSSRLLRSGPQHWFEDFALGRVFDHAWGRTMNEAETVEFSTMTLHFNRIYFDRPYARGLGFRDIVVNPLLVYNTVMGLSVNDLTEGRGPFLGMQNLRYGVPVFPGDTLTASSEVVARRESDSRPGWGIVTWHSTGRNQDGEVVVDYQRTNLSRKNPNGES